MRKVLEAVLPEDGEAILLGSFEVFLMEDAGDHRGGHDVALAEVGEPAGGFAGSLAVVMALTQQRYVKYHKGGDPEGSRFRRADA